MSERVTARVYQSSQSTGADRLVLFALAHRAWGDGCCLRDRQDLEDGAGVSTRQWNRSMLALALADEVLYLRSVGRGARPVVGILCGLPESDRVAVARRAWHLAVTEGRDFDHVDARTLRAETDEAYSVPLPRRLANPKPGQGVLFSPVQNPDSSSGYRDRLSGFSPYTVFPTPDKEQQHTREETEGERRAAAPLRLTPDQAAARQALLGLGVFDRPAERIVTTMAPDWVREVILAGRHLQRRGRTSGLGGLVVRMADGLDPLPALDPVPSVPASVPRQGDGAWPEAEPVALSDPGDVARYGLVDAGLLANHTPLQLRRDLGRHDLAEIAEARADARTEARLAETTD